MIYKCIGPIEVGSLKKRMRNMLQIFNRVISFPTFFSQQGTNKFQSEIAFGLQHNTPYKNVINSAFLRYREQGWFRDQVCFSL